jgi:AraC-like DNA-binding protein
MYQFFLPPSLLQPFIQNYWRLRSSGFSLEERIFVDYHADIIFNFGVAYERRYLHLADTADMMPVSNLDGQRDYPLAIVQNGDIDLVAVRFKPGGLAAFMPMPAHELSNVTLDLYSAFGHEGLVLENQLFDAAHDSVRQITLLNEFFLRRLNVGNMHTFTQKIAQRIDAHNGSISIQALSDEAGYSIRTVNRFFHQYFGVSPKAYARVVRFQHVLALMSKQTHLSLTEIALSCGYYDPAHFSKEFSAFAGQNPERYREFLIAKTQAPPPNLVQFLQAE